MYCRLIPLDKKPGLRLTGVWEVLRRTADIAVMMLFKIDITHATDASQLTAGHDAEFDADAQAMHDIFSTKKKKKKSQNRFTN